jgi:hypothetical protein
MEDLGKGRNCELGQMAYEAYCKALAKHQEHRCVLWHRFPVHMQEVWVSVAEAIEKRVKNSLKP